MRDKPCFSCSNPPLYIRSWISFENQISDTQTFLVNIKIIKSLFDSVCSRKNKKSVHL
ncbi:hypothetical protein N5D_22600 [Enterococcus faecalis]|nr:hypothetical protein N4E_26640 [Enterococcus faecalis]GEJ64721.1 hypothetical protein EfaecalisJ2_23670 [Enterococcus faecalis]GEJ68397.1 hypothetical protein EfaecalisJ4_05590 [Enterococcus faecalis]GEJ70518.1 hypothetical protein EfaecalisJ5_00520 [Enterococcus faecalis]GEJ75267.1 hypothetical protein EfaecalisJ6_20840 [Enterococcus faecalis]